LARASDPPGDADDEFTGIPGERCAGHCDVDEDGDGLWNETSDDSIEPTYVDRDPFYVFDDDEDGIYDEDGEEDPLLVHVRALDGECASGKHPYVPRSRKDEEADAEYAQLPGSTFEDNCRPVAEASVKQTNGEAADPWVYQVQYGTREAIRTGS
jgi:hypothetical protein